MFFVVPEKKGGDKALEGVQIVMLPIKAIKEYKNNAKLHPKEQIERIKHSIQEFGFNDPIAVWGEDNTIIEGHGRLKALKELGYKEVPAIRLDHLTDEQRKAYTLAHNKVSESEWDYDLVNFEIESLAEDFDFEQFGFEFELVEEDEEEEPKEKKNERLRTDEAYNLPYVDIVRCEGKYQMPIIEPEDYIPESLVGFNYALSHKDKDVGIHFYIDDYQFERIWNEPNKYITVLSDFDCVLTPDFSLYMDMPISMKIWNVFRSRLIGQMCQDAGLIVIPTVSWAEKETFEFCFDGLPENSVLSISTIGVKNSPEALQIWCDGVTELIKQKSPHTLLVYGGELEFDYGDIEVIYFANAVTERMRNN